MSDQLEGEIGRGSPWMVALVAALGGLALDSTIILLTDYTPQFWFHPITSMWGPFGMPLFFDSPGVTVTFGVAIMWFIRKGKDW